MNKIYRVAAAAAVALAGSSTMAADAMTKVSTKPVYVCQMTPSTSKEYSKPGICPTDGMELINKNAQLRVAVLVFNDAEIIDFAGPMEVFAASGAKIFTVAPTKKPVLTGDSLRIVPDYDIDHAPEADILVIPGGSESVVSKDVRVMNWLRKRSVGPGTVMSVCTGAIILAKAGLLDGISATVTSTALNYLTKTYPKTLVVRDRRFVDAGKIVTTGGLSAGIDGALHMIERMQGSLRAQDVARYLEYDWKPEGKSSAGSLARLVLPQFAPIFPSDVSWERLTDEGDTEHWTVSGRLELVTTGEQFVDAATAKLKEQGWVASTQNNSILERSFSKRYGTQDWVMTISLTTEQIQAAFRMDMNVYKASPARS